MPAHLPQLKSIELVSWGRALQVRCMWPRQTPPCRGSTTPAGAWARTCVCLWEATVCWHHYPGYLWRARARPSCQSSWCWQAWMAMACSTTSYRCHARDGHQMSHCSVTAERGNTALCIFQAVEQSLVLSVSRSDFADHPAAVRSFQHITAASGSEQSLQSLQADALLKIPHLPSALFKHQGKIVSARHLQTAALLHDLHVLFTSLQPL